MTSGLLITKRIFLDFRIVTRDTPATCFRPSFDMIFLAFFSPLDCLALLAASSPTAATPDSPAQHQQGYPPTRELSHHHHQSRFQTHSRRFPLRAWSWCSNRQSSRAS